MQCYLELSDILYITKFGTKVKVVDEFSNKVFFDDTHKENYKATIPNTILRAVPCSFRAEDNSVIIGVCVEQDDN